MVFTIQKKAKAEFAKAKEALQGEGVQFPVHLDLPVDQSSKLSVAQAQSLKQTIEKSLGSENVVIDINQMSSDDMNNVTSNAANAAAEDWDISNGVGWGPDYQDPSTYLDILKQHQVKIPRLSMVMMIQTMQQQPK